MNNKLRTTIIGSAGQLGSDLVETLQKHPPFEVIPLTRDQVDCTDHESVHSAVLQTRPDIVINCAAFVRVDECEDVPEQAFAVNALGALYVARACAKARALCVYISTDYVFNGSKASPYTESDITLPINVYGVSKLSGEFLVRQATPRWLIVRSASLFGRIGARGKGGNFIETVLAKAKRGEPLRVVSDVRMSPTYTRDVAQALASLIEAETQGIFHLTNDGGSTWHELATEALKLAGIPGSIDTVSASEYPSRALRPKNSALGSEHSLIKLRPWQEALESYLIEKGHRRGTR